MSDWCSLWCTSKLYIGSYVILCPHAHSSIILTYTNIFENMITHVCRHRCFCILYMDKTVFWDPDIIQFRIPKKENWDYVSDCLAITYNNNKCRVKDFLVQCIFILHCLFLIWILTSLHVCVFVRRNPNKASLCLNHGLCVGQSLKSVTKGS